MDWKALDARLKEPLSPWTQQVAQQQFTGECRTPTALPDVIECLLWIVCVCVRERAVCGAHGQSDERGAPSQPRAGGPQRPPPDGHRAGGLAAPHPPDAQIQHRHGGRQRGDPHHHRPPAGQTAESHLRRCLRMFGSVGWQIASSFIHRLKIKTVIYGCASVHTELLFRPPSGSF